MNTCAYSPTIGIFYHLGGAMICKILQKVPLYIHWVMNYKEQKLNHPGDGWS